MKNVVISIVILVLFGACTSPAPGADPTLEQAKQLFQAGQNAEALQTVQRYLREWPNEPRGVFLQGLILDRMGRTDEAMNVYQSLIRTHPQFPEPYNNLAGLLAGQGRFEEAMETLHQALQTHPSYAAAHQNLSRIYSAMASQAYRRVLGDEEGHVQVSLDPLKELTFLAELTLLTDMPGPASAAAPERPAPPLGTADEQAPEAVPPAPALVALADEKDEQPRPAAEILPQVEQPAPVQPVFEEEAVPADEDILQAIPGPGLQQIMKAQLQEWANAWARQDVEAYLSFYSRSFVPEGGLCHEAWTEQRMVRVVAPPFIRITLSNVSVTELDEDVIQVHFSQHYRSNVINDRVRKELLFKKDDGQWRIIRERLLPR